MTSEVDLWPSHECAKKQQHTKQTTTTKESQVADKLIGSGAGIETQWWEDHGRQPRHRCNNAKLLDEGQAIADR